MHQITNPFDQLDRRLSAIEELLVRALHPNAPAFQPTEDSNPDGVITAQKLRERLDISEATERQWVKSGLLKPKYLGRRVYYVWSDVVEALRRNDNISQPVSFRQKRRKIAA